jgi:hypothetical protein
MSDRILVATRKGLFTVERASGQGPRWEVSRAAFLGDNVTHALRDGRDGKFYAALHHGHFGDKLHRSIDEGETWEECGVPVYPEKPEDFNPPPSAMGTPPSPWSLKLLWCVAPGGPNESGVLWCGTIPGGLFRSGDGGATWTMNRPLWDEPKRLEWFGGGYDHPGIHSICVDPRDAKHVIVGVSCGGAWETRDGGACWSCCATGMRAEYMPPERQFDPHIQDPHLIVRCPSAPDCLWAQHHNGVFRSTDNAASWQEIEKVPPSVFGFAVAVHPNDPDTAWFVPAIKDEHRIPVDGRVVVSRTRDGGKSFDVLSDGLPGPHAYDLTFRHALDVDASGDRLVFGSTTGSLWVSEDQGDHWRRTFRRCTPRGSRNRGRRPRVGRAGAIATGRRRRRCGRRKDPRAIRRRACTKGRCRGSA